MKEEIKQQIIKFIKKNCGDKVIIIDCKNHIEVNCNYISKSFLDQLVTNFQYNFAIIGNHISNIYSLKLLFGNVEQEV